MLSGSWSMRCAPPSTATRWSRRGCCWRCWEAYGRTGTAPTGYPSGERFQVRGKGGSTPQFWQCRQLGRKAWQGWGGT